jgi:CRP-like cAMP-binding protein
MESLLNAIRYFIPLSASDEEVVRKLFHKKFFKKGEHLLRAGNICRYVTFIEAGLVRYYINSDGEERTTYFNKEGEFVCYYASFLPQTPSDIHIQALEDTSIFVVSFNDLQEFYREVEYGERFGRLGIEQVFLNAISQVASFYTDTPEVRYTKFLSDFRDIVQRIPQYYIASYVGIKPQSLSRIRKRTAGKH